VQEEGDGAESVGDEQRLVDGVLHAGLLSMRALAGDIVFAAR